jgi:hypothetical protein
MTDVPAADPRYPALVRDVSGLLASARRASARAVNAVMTATYWEIGRRIVEYEQGGAKRAAYGERLIQRLSRDLSARFGRGFGVDNVELFRTFYLAYPPDVTWRTPPAISESPIRKSSPRDLAARFPLSWTHYVHLLRRARSAEARHFYEGGPPRRLVGTPTRSPDRLPVLRAHRALQEQGRHADEGCAARGR